MCRKFKCGLHNFASIYYRVIALDVVSRKHTVLKLGKLIRNDKRINYLCGFILKLFIEKYLQHEFNRKPGNNPEICPIIILTISHKYPNFMWTLHTVNSVYNSHSKIDKTKVLTTNGS